jgi:hypothetical protein
MDEDELTDAEKSALAGLPAESALPAGLEDRVVEALRARGLVGGSKPARHRGWQAAAAAAIFVCGVGSGLLLRRPASPAGRAAAESTYLLLLYPGPGYVAGDAADEAKRVAEYGAWAGRVRLEGRLLGAEMLGAPALVLDADGLSASGEGPQGYFLVRARSLDEARSIARGCPHLGHGGRITVQVVDPT